MAKTVREIMNPELFSLRPNDDGDDALGYILALGITAAPVLDEARQPVGVASFRDFLLPRGPSKVAERMTVPAVSVSFDASVEDTARLLAERGVHHVVVVDREGRAVGVASTLDVIRGLLGLPATHPATFPHWDRTHGVAWTDDTLLELDRVDVAPDGPGVLVLVRGGPNVSERVVWAEAAHNVRTRLYDILSRPQKEQPILDRILAEHGHLRFRAASLMSLDERQRLAESLLAESIRSARLPRASE
jgi:hypothetical protein